MMPTFKERQELAKQFGHDVERMLRCLQAVGRTAKTDHVVRAWADYCDSVCASWLRLPEDDQQLLDILLRYLPEGATVDHKTGVFTTRMVDAGDGTGDGILELPDELLASLDWKEGDVLTVSKTETGDLLLRRVN